MEKRLIVLVLLLALLAGCTPRTTTEQAAEPETLSWFVNFSWFTAGWGKNHVTQAITEKTGVQVNFLTPVGDENETLDVMLRQGELPDLITLGWWLPQAGTLIEEDLVYPLNQLADELAPEFYDAADPQRLFWYTQDDGNIYGYPSASASPQAFAEGAVEPSNETFLVRKDLYEALGCPDMTTPEGFADALRRAVETFPEVDGAPLLALGCLEFNQQGNASLSDHLRDFLAIPREIDGQAVDYKTDADYITWLKTFRALLEEGTLTAELLVDRRQQVQENFQQGRYFCLFYQWSDLEAQQRLRFSQDPDSAYIAVDGPRNSRGDDHTLSGVGMNGWTLTFISKDCENPQKAMELMIFLMGEEGQQLVSLGVEGLDYTWEHGVPVRTEEADLLLRTDYAAYVATVGADNIYWMLMDNELQSRWMLTQEPALEQIMAWGLPYTVDATPYEVSFAPGSEAARIDAREQRLWGETLPQLLLAESDAAFDEILAEYVAARESLGWEQLQREKERQYAANREKLNALADQAGGAS